MLRDDNDNKILISDPQHHNTGNDGNVQTFKDEIRYDNKNENQGIGSNTYLSGTTPVKVENQKITDTHDNKISNLRVVGLGNTFYPFFATP